MMIILFLRLMCLLSLSQVNALTITPAVRGHGRLAHAQVPERSFSSTTVLGLSSESSSTNQITPPPPNPPVQQYRKVAKVEQFARLPVWPVWMGVILFIVSRLFGADKAAQLEDWTGGRVCPNFFSSPEKTSPFLMLVHHRHSFAKWDPIRFVQNKWILPEGFPAHPHRGFTTLTYFMKGGFSHRDSLGVAQDYGASDDGNDHHSQWLFTGAGVLHEEMFLPHHDQHDLYQLWINVPSANKMLEPQVALLGPNECPTVVGDGDSSQTIVLAGQFGTSRSKAPIMSPMTILHIRISPNEYWEDTLGDLSAFETVVMYIRQGGCAVVDDTDEDDAAPTTHIPSHHTAYLEVPTTTATKMILRLHADKQQGVDLFLLAGQPLGEPVSAQGSMVMNSDSEIQTAYRDYQLGAMGTPWDHELTNGEWKQHIQNHPSRYTYSRTSATTTTDQPKVFE